jgi:hypothetical protein
MIALFIGLIAAALLLVSSYLFGARLGHGAREKLRQQALQQAREIEILDEKLESFSREDEKGLRAAIEGALDALAQQNHGRITLDLSRLKTDAGEGRNLSALLDMIAEAGAFDAVVLSDSDGLALASNPGATDVDRIAAASTRVLMMVDRVASGGRLPASSVMLQDEAAHTMMFRIFNAQNQRLCLAVSSPTDLRATPSSLNAAVATIADMLSTEQA